MPHNRRCHTGGNTLLHRGSKHKQWQNSFAMRLCHMGIGYCSLAQNALPKGYMQAINLCASCASFTCPQGYYP